MPDLLTIGEAAARLNLPPYSLRRAAEEHGHLVRVGKAVRVEADRLGDLIAKCRQPMGQG